MADIEVKVHWKGRLIKTITRPKRAENGVSAVVYKKKVYAVESGGRIDIDSPPLRDLHDAGEGADVNNTQEPPAAPKAPKVLTKTPATVEGTVHAKQPARAKSAEPRRRDVPDDWDPEQLAVIGLAPSERVLVSAGPGMGKTAVACARVAKLVALDGVEPANIWLVSFTRTAVREIRNRIMALVKKEDRASAVRITTLDSHAWHLAQGFDGASAKNPFRGYDQTIASVIALLNEGSDELEEYLESLEHLIVDEAQDLVGSRAELVDALIKQLPATCGVTVFVDDAQAIYGWTADDTKPEPGGPDNSLPNLLRTSNHFRTMELRTVHRTDSEGLRKIFEITRAKVLKPNDSAVAKVLEVRTDIETFADGRVEEVLKQGLKGREDALLLFRKRGEVLMASSFLLEAGIAHRVRMSGLPVCIAPWVAITLRDFTDRYLTREQFEQRWADRIGMSGDAQAGSDKAWSNLIGVAGDRGGRIELRRLRMKLGTGTPPLAFCTPELGTSGPIVGTIHASKGREADVVHLMLPKSSWSKDPDGKDKRKTEEEGRVLFVGATRARGSLHVGSGYQYSGVSLKGSGRVYRHVRKGKGTSAHVEIGRAGDLDEMSCVADGYFDATAINQNQKLLQGIAGSIIPASILVVQLPNGEYRWHLYAMHNGQSIHLGQFGNNLVHDLFEVGKAVREWQSWGMKLRPKHHMDDLYTIGVRSVVLAPDHAHADSLANPYSDTGIFLCPIVYGFPRVQFSGYKDK